MAALSADPQEMPAFAFAFQARRFACDRCHRYKLKCERGPLIMTSGVATPLGPCKRCEKARVECTSSNAVTSSTSKRTTSNSHDSNPVPESTITNPPQDTSNVTNTAIDSSNDIGSFSPLNRPLSNPVEAALAEPSLFDNFDFDLGINGEENLDPYNISSTLNRGLLSPDKSQTSLRTKETETAEQSQFGGGEHAGEYGLPMSDLLYTPPAESPRWTGHHPPPSTIGMTEPADSINPLMNTLDNLSKLQSFIFKEFGSISEGTLAATFLTEGHAACHSLDHGLSKKNLVGKVLCASEQLIDILTSCGRTEADLPSVSSPLRSRGKTLCGSKRSRSNILDDDEPVHADLTPRVASSAVNPTTTRLHWMRKNSKLNGRLSPLSIKTRARSETSIYPDLLSPAKMTLLVCYVTLLGVYRSILTQAFDMLRTEYPPTPSRAPKNGTFNGSKAASLPQPPINGTTILSFRIQLEMLTHTLEQIDDAWAAALQRGTELSGGKHREGVTATQVLLQSMLVHEGFECDDEGDAAGLGSLMLQVQSEG
ncbi:MAG: hypothetical protein Q9170_001509 [Blastenia crenularia]